MVLAPLAIATVPQTAWTATSGGRMLSFNRAWYERDGRRCTPNATPASLEKQWWAAVHRDDRARCRQALQSGVTSRAGFEFELRLLRAGGTYRWYRLFVSPFEEAQDDGAGSLGICTDIDAYKRPRSNLCLSRASR